MTLFNTIQTYKRPTCKRHVHLSHKHDFSINNVMFSRPMRAQNKDLAECGPSCLARLVAPAQKPEVWELHLVAGLDQGKEGLVSS